MNGASFRWFTPDKDEHAEALGKNQDWADLGTDPYLQLEKHYNHIGDEAEAREMYPKGRHNARKSARVVFKKPRALGENADAENSYAPWLWQRHVYDWILEW
jgi:hypothetical protein